MEIPLPPLPRSESKSRFMIRLGLDMRDPRHRQVYDMMKNEASNGRERIIERLNQPQSTRQQLQLSSETYSTSQIQEAVFNAEIFRIYQTAQPATRIMYDMAHDPNHPNEPNWVIRWMLWHVFRYRDGRQKDKGTGRERGDARSDDEDHDGGGGSSKSNFTSTTSATQSTSGLYTAGQRTYFDPVRDQWSN